LEQNGIEVHAEQKTRFFDEVIPWRYHKKPSNIAGFFFYS
jgi:hypothetical protein